MYKLTKNPSKAIRLIFTAAVMFAAFHSQADVTGVAVPTDIQALVDDPGRSINDQGRDAVRRPAELLTFSGIQAGMHVFEIGAGAGYTTELLARRVGSTGQVYAQNNQNTLDSFVKDKLKLRLEKTVMSNVSEVVSETGTPFPENVNNLDAVVIVLFYHDIAYMDVDRAKLNKAVWDALKPGGTYIIVDHRAVAGAGSTVAKSLHRIEESSVRKEIEASGFVLESQSEFLANPNDPKTQPFFKIKGSTDRFAHRYRKPQS